MLPLADLSNLVQIYQETKLLDDFKEKSKNTIKVPVSLDLYRFRDRYHKHDEATKNYRYNDEYTFNDKIIIYDQNTGFNRGKKNLLESLKRTNKQTFFEFWKDEKEYNVDYQRQDHVDWTDNKHGLKLSEILTMEPDHTEAFKPADKRITLNYNFQHTRRINLYSYYLIPGTGKIKNRDNFHEKITFGKQKTNPVLGEKLFQNFSKDVDFCLIKNRILTVDQQKLIQSADEEGYEGVCDNLTLSHDILNYDNDKKWGTPYVAYDYKKSLMDWEEYYHYVLGGYSDTYGKSKNLIEGEDNKRIWAVNYNEIFKIDVLDNSNTIKISFDLDKFKEEAGKSAKKTTLTNEELIERVKDFLKVSELFDFEFSFQERDEEKKLTFDIGRIISGEAKIKDRKEETIYSNISLSIKLKNSMKNRGIELMDRLEEQKYTVNTQKLFENNLILDHIYVKDNKTGQEKLLPSQFLNDEVISEYFLYSANSGRGRIKFNKSDIQKMNFSREFNDKEGTLKIKYYDIVEKKYKEVSWYGMKEIPTNLKIDAKAKDFEEAKKLLKEKFQLPEYFLENIKFVPINSKDAFNQHRNYKIVYSGTNTTVRAQWSGIISNIEILNEHYIEPISTVVTEEMKSADVSSWFRFRNNDQRDNYDKFKFIKRSDLGNENITVEVTVKENGEKQEFYFKVAPVVKTKEVPEEPKITPKIFEEEKVTENSGTSEKAITGVGCAIMGGGLTSLAAKLLPIIRRRF